MEMERTTGFGAPAKLGAHLFRVELPTARNEPVSIVEDCGYHVQTRVLLPQHIWIALADSAEDQFNARLKTLKLPMGRWHSGTNLMDRLLGKELCVLAWAAETATDEQILTISNKWEKLHPEERWWLFAMTVAEAGLAEDTERGWRRAIFHALSDGESIQRKYVNPAGRGLAAGS
ncbi:MAG: DUF3780 domain-containing protein [Nitrospira sp.]|nr:DUF3780 domain-containing protein [Nitrospira sp.]